MFYDRIIYFYIPNEVYFWFDEVGLTWTIQNIENLHHRGEQQKYFFYWLIPKTNKPLIGQNKIAGKFKKVSIAMKKWITDLVEIWLRFQI
jgi:hypothetical protein